LGGTLPSHLPNDVERRGEGIKDGKSFSFQRRLQAFLFNTVRDGGRQEPENWYFSFGGPN